MRYEILKKFFINNNYISLSYNDISIQPITLSDIKTRDSVNVYKKIVLNSNDEILLDIPVFLSPMEYYDENSIRLINTFKTYFYKDDNIYLKVPIFPFLHRFGKYSDLKNRIEVAESLKRDDMIFGISLSLREIQKIIDENNISKIKHISDISDIILVDIANGYMRDLYKYIDIIKQKYSYIKIIIGNITGDYELPDEYKNSFDYIRVGIASSPLCSTYIKTGIGVGMITSIFNVYDMKINKNMNFNIIADGGMKNFKDVFYSILFGADYIMTNTLFSYTELNSNKIISQNNKFYKEVYGMASKKISNKMYIEGITKYIEIPHDAIEYILENRDKTLFEYVVDNIKTSLKSSLSYIGIDDINKIDEAVFKIYINTINSYTEKNI